MKKILNLIILSLITSFFIQNTAFNNPYGLQNEAGVCYANAALQTIFVTPKIENFVRRLDDSIQLKQNFKLFYASYRDGNPDNNIKMQIIREIMGENISVQSSIEFLSKLFDKLGYPGFPTENEAIYNELGVKFGTGPNHIANLVNTGGHYFAEVKYNDIWYRVDDGSVKSITKPTPDNTAGLRISIAFEALAENERFTLHEVNIEDLLMQIALAESNCGGEESVQISMLEQINRKQYLIDDIYNSTNTIDDIYNLQHIKNLLNTDIAPEKIIETFQQKLLGNIEKYFRNIEDITLLNEAGKEELLNFLEQNIR